MTSKKSTVFSKGDQIRLPSFEIRLQITRDVI